MFKNMIFFGALILTASAAMAAEMQASDAEGVWQTKTGGYVELYEEDGSFKGTIVGSTSGKSRMDENNPDESKRDRRLLGTTVLKGLQYAGDGEFEGGSIYDPNNGKTYSAKATLKDADTLDVRGYIGISLIGRSQTWTRVDPGAPNVNQDLLHNAGHSQ